MPEDHSHIPHPEVQDDPESVLPPRQQDVAQLNTFIIEAIKNVPSGDFSGGRYKEFKPRINPDSYFGNLTSLSVGSVPAEDDDAPSNDVFVRSDLGVTIYSVEEEDSILEIRKTFQADQYSDDLAALKIQKGPLAALQELINRNKLNEQMGLNQVNMKEIKELIRLLKTAKSVE
jgi:hypothetical protein